LLLVRNPSPLLLSVALYWNLKS